MSAPSSRRRCSRCGWCARAARGHRSRPARSAAAAACSARSRNILSRGWRSATPLCSAARWCATRRWQKTRPMSRAPKTRTPKCRPIWAASFRSPPTSPSACANLLADPARLERAAGSGARMARSQQCALGRCRGRGELLVETFPRGDKNYLVCYPFEGRLAHQTLGMLLTRRLERRTATSARLRRQRICPRGVEPRRSRARSAPARSRSPISSTKTCWATTSKRGLPNPR